MSSIDPILSRSRRRRISARRLGMSLAALWLGLSLASCGRTRVYAGSIVQGAGVRVELREAEIEREDASIALMAYNDTNEEVLINRNQIALVGPQGEVFRVGGREVHRIKPRGRHPVNMGMRISPQWRLNETPGVYLRFDGFYVGYQRVQIPPLALGKPTHGPGSTVAHFESPAQMLERREAKKDAAGRLAQSLETSASDNDAAGVQTYQGPRYKVRQQGLRCAAMPLKLTDISDALASVVDDLLLTELQQAGFDAIGHDDINAMLGFETTKDMVGCDDASCVAEIGNALGVQYLVAGSVAKVEGAAVITLKILDVQAGRVLARANKIGDGGEAALPRVVGEVVQDLVQRSKM